ncbi:hypothetical protein LINPERHAP2_LOCUS32549, partial [Linum perenne]
AHQVLIIPTVVIHQQHYLLLLQILQDLHLGKRIGIAELKQGLYHMIQEQPPPIPGHVFSAAFSTLASPTKHFDLWHYRLGHLSHARLSILQQLDSAISSKPEQQCAICHFAKQRKLSF